MFALFRVKESRNNLQGIYAVTFLTLAILMALPSFLFLFYGFAKWRGIFQPNFARQWARELAVRVSTDRQHQRKSFKVF